ncbi:response regulator [Candidatus Poribacteria bacterium]|nr:response regulator [Candidatus Poribacteria bacterium]
MAKKHILLIDDEPNTLLTIQFILEVANYKVTTATTGKEALDKILEATKSDDKIDLLVLDISMPCLTGLELIDELKRLDINIPILVITGYRPKELVIALMRKGCGEYLDKPFDDEELIKRITMLLEKRSIEP